jgi:hypothetical protein
MSTKPALQKILSHRRERKTITNIKGWKRIKLKRGN